MMIRSDRSVAGGFGRAATAGRIALKHHSCRPRARDHWFAAAGTSPPLLRPSCSLSSLPPRATWAGARLGAAAGSAASAAAAAAAAARRRPAFDSDAYEEEEEDEDAGSDVEQEQQQESSSAATMSTAATAAAAAAAAAPASAESADAASARRARRAKKTREQRRQQQHRGGSNGNDDDEAAAWSPGDGIVGAAVAAWMAVISVLMAALRPAVSLALALAQPLTHMSPARARRQIAKMASELPDGFWAKAEWLWERPLVRSLRMTATVANWSFRLPAIAALLLTQGSVLASQVSLPMLAPLLLGTGMMLNSIKANASFLIPRLGLTVVLLWVLWFTNGVVQNTWLVLRNQGRIDARTMSGARMVTEVSSLLLAGIVVLSTMGVNVASLLLPTGVVLAIASRDLLQNLIAGFYLVLVQPFRLGDKVAVSCSGSPPPSFGGGGGASVAPGAAGAGRAGLAAAASAAAARSGGHALGGNGNGAGGGLGAPLGWFEGVCEKVDLRYTVLRDGRRRLMVPNTAFVSREFLVYDDAPAPLGGNGGSIGGGVSGAVGNNSVPLSPAATNQATSGPSAQPAQPGSPQQQHVHGHQQHQQQQQQQQLFGPAIVEGLPATELPPLAPPIFPGVPAGATAGPFFAGAQPMHPLHAGALHWFANAGNNGNGSGNITGEQGGAAAAAAAGGAGQEQQQQQTPANNIVSAAGAAGAATSSSSPPSLQQQQQQQQPAAAAKGPPGYLPQGFAPAGPYVSMVPVYYGHYAVSPQHAQQHAQQHEQQHAQQHAQQQTQQQQPNAAANAPAGGSNGASSAPSASSKQQQQQQQQQQQHDAAAAAAKQQLQQQGSVNGMAVGAFGLYSLAPPPPPPGLYHQHQHHQQLPGAYGYGVPPFAPGGGGNGPTVPMTNDGGFGGVWALGDLDQLL